MKKCVLFLAIVLSACAAQNSIKSYQKRNVVFGKEMEISKLNTIKRREITSATALSDWNNFYKKYKEGDKIYYISRNKLDRTDKTQNSHFKGYALVRDGNVIAEYYDSIKIF